MENKRREKARVKEGEGEEEEEYSRERKIGCLASEENQKLWLYCSRATKRAPTCQNHWLPKRFPHNLTVETSQTWLKSANGAHEAR